jgi:hypothetical protein
MMEQYYLIILAYAALMIISYNLARPYFDK